MYMYFGCGKKINKIKKKRKVLNEIFCLISLSYHYNFYFYIRVSLVRNDKGKIIE